MSHDTDRATWTARVVIAMTERMSDADRIRYLNNAYDVARGEGVIEGINRLASGLKIPTIPVQAL